MRGDGSIQSPDPGIVRELQGVVRHRKVLLSDDILDGHLPENGTKLSFELFPGHEFTGTVELSSVNVNGTSALSGKIDGEIYSYFAIATTDGVSSAEFSFPEKGIEYSVYPRGTAYYAFDYNPSSRGFMEGEHPDTSSFPLSQPLPPGADAVLIPPPGMPDSMPSVPSDSNEDANAEIGVMLVYTPNAKTYADSSLGGIANAVSLTMSKGQTVLNNSNMGMTWTLVHSAEVSYTEGNSSTDLNRLTSTSDGYIDEIHTWRENYGGDIVGFLTKVDDTGGLGWLLNTTSGNKAYAFHITRIQQATWTATDIHEAGHNMGAHHSKTQTTQKGPGLYTYSAGWQWAHNPPPSNYSTGYCTVMTYENFDSAGSAEYKRIDYFSTPSLSPAEGGSHVCGDAADGDNKRGIENVKGIIAAYCTASGVVSIVTSASSANLPEGGTATFQVKLSAKPSSNATVSVSRSSGDSDISVSSGASLTFTTSNWSTYQTVTLAAAEDNSDNTNGTATITCSATGLANTTVTATETDDDFSLTIIASNGSVTKTPNTSFYDSGSNVQLTPVPNSGYVFSNWSGDLSGLANPANLIMNANKSVTANFTSGQPQTATLSMSASPSAGGTTTPSTGAHTVTVGQVQSITATASSSLYTFTNWTATAGATLGNANSASTTVILQSSATVTANFSIKTYTIKYTAGPGGLINGASPQTVSHGASGSLVTAVPSAGYHFVKWSDDVMTAARTDTNITANKTFTANFAEASPWDFNGDGKADLASETTAGDGWLYFMNGQTMTSYSKIYDKTNQDWAVVRTADFNGDGKADLLWKNASTGDFLIYLMNGALTTQMKNICKGGFGWFVKTIADFNGDKKADILWENATGAGHLYLMNGCSIISSAAIYQRNPAWTIKQTADFNGDGKADLLWEHTDGTGYIYLMNGTAILSHGTAYMKSTTSAWNIIKTGDFNGDTKADLLWEHTDGSGAIYLMNGLSIASTGFAYKKSVGWTVKNTADFNGDGKTDIHWEHSSGTGSVWLMNGIATSSAGTVYTKQDMDWNVIRILDFSGDGKADMLWEHAFTRKVIVYLMNGFTVTSTGTVYSSGNDRHVLDLE